MRTQCASLIAIALVALSCGSTHSGIALDSGAESVVAPTPTHGSPAGTPPPGLTRLTDDLGGISVDMPFNWYDEVSPSPSHARTIRSFDPKLTADGGTIPPPGAVAVRVELRQDTGITELESFADREVWTATCASCRRIVERRQTHVGGQDALFFSVSQNQPRPFDALEPTLYWLVRSPFFADRVLVIHATPGGSPLRPVVERMVDTVQFYSPVPASLTPTRTRQEVVASFQSRGWSITRIEAKLVTQADWQRALARAPSDGGPRIGYGSLSDPDTLLWIVAFTGSGFTLRGSIGPPGPGMTFAPPPEWGWSLSVLPAKAPYDWGGPTFGGPEATWPAYFDQLVDRDR
jgi:hypothetical protein